jgi:PIN domain nuclease of toxin-antitoxin system
MAMQKSLVLLLDTHAFLWWVEGSGDLSATAVKSIKRAKIVYLSVASCWELAIKVSRGKLKLTKSIEAYVSEHLAANGFDLLDIGLNHIGRVEKMPFHHNDPFDRLIIAQALALKLAVVTADGEFPKYKGLQVVW